MLYLIGLGLWDEKDITVRGLEIAKECRKVYLEAYTTKLGGLDLERLSRMVGKPVIKLDRTDIEEKPEFLEEAREGDIAIMVGGDPLVATTHQDLMVRAMELGIKTRVIHNSSIVSAISETGLQIYKFGKTVTIPFWTERFKPTSFFEKITQNKKLGMHTLVLLDIDAKAGKYMTANEGLELITRLDTKNQINTAIVVARLGAPNQRIVWGDITKLMSMEFGPPPHSIVIPGELHDMELKLLELAYKAG